MCLLGLDGVAMLRSTEPVELLALSAITEQVADLRAKEREDLATRIINTLGKALK